MTHRLSISLAIGAGLLLGACGGTQSSAPPVDETPDAGVTRPSEYIRPEDPPPTAKLSTEQLTAAMKTGFQTAFQLQTQPIFDTYHSLLMSADGAGGCPPMTVNTTAQGENTFWQGDCTAQSGTAFRGFGYVVTLTNAYGDDGAITNGWYAGIQGRVADGHGNSVDGAGTAAAAVAHSADNSFTYWAHELHGTFLLQNNGVSTPWTDGSRRVDLQVVAAYIPSTTGHLMSFNGGLSGLGGDVDSISFEGVEISQLLSGSKCEKEPAGTISLRDSNGQWYDLAFDAPKRDGPDTDPALCDGCGRVYFRGQSIGEVCADFSYLFAWGSTPW